MKFIILLSLIWGGISGISYLTYRYGNASSWDESLHQTIEKIISLVGEAFADSGAGDMEAIEPPLDTDEAIQLVKTFDRKPYEIPALAGYQVKNGLMVFNVHSVGLASKYRGLENDNESLTRILRFKIYNHFLEVRGIPVPVCIRFATPTHLCFAVPFTERGQRSLQAYVEKRRRSQQDDRSQKTGRSGSPVSLEEEIPAPEIKKEEPTDDPGLSP